MVLGRALAGIPRDQYLLATKVGRYGQEEFDFSARRVTESVEESLRRLGVETLDLVHCHDIEFGSLAQVSEETLPALERLRTQGKIRLLGLSGYPLRIFPTVLESTSAGARADVILSYCHYYLGNNLLVELLPWLHQQGVGVINASPLGMGLLRDARPPDWHPAPPELRAACAAAAAHCRRRGASLADLALRYALAEERIATTLVGIAGTEELRRNLAAVGAPPDPVLLAEVLEILRPVRNLEWPSGRPENR